MLQVLDNHPLQVMLFIYKFECDLGYTVLPGIALGYMDEIHVFPR